MLIRDYKNIDKVVLNDIIKYKGQWYIVDRILVKEKTLIVTEI
jgi:hypothetical protein